MMIELRKGKSRLEVDTQGAFIRTWQVGRHTGLHSDTTRPRRATHPCGPNFGIMSLHAEKDGKYVVNGKEYQLPQHGYLRDREWEVIRKTADSVILGVECSAARPDPELLTMYPFYHRFTLALKLTGNQLHYRLTFSRDKSLGNFDPKGEDSAPLDLASHTYHPWEEGLMIEGLSRLYYTDAAEAKPIARRFQGKDFGELKDREYRFSARFHRNFKIKYPLSEKEISVALGTHKDDIATELMVVWDKTSEGRFICLEPVFVGPNSFNVGGPVRIAHGDKASLSFVLTLRDLGC